MSARKPLAHAMSDETSTAVIRSPTDISVSIRSSGFSGTNTS
jgi:hypothetical protein